MPICFVHAYLVHREIDDLLYEQPEVKPKAHLVYYLAISPTIIKIGFTADLPGRMRGLRTDLQYVLAVEPGGRDIESLRHRQFATDRLSKREDFHASPALLAHIEYLRDNTHSEELMDMYRTRDKARR